MTDDRKATHVPRRRRPELSCEYGSRPAAPAAPVTGFRTGAAGSRLGAGGIGRLGAPAAGHRCRAAEAEPGRAVRLEISTAGPRGRVAVVTVAGEIDLRTVEVLRQGLLDLADAGFRRFVVDFDQVRFCDATGLGALVAVHNRVHAQGGGVRLSRVRPPQRKLFAVTGLDRLFAMHASVQDAVGRDSASTTAPQG